MAARCLCCRNGLARHCTVHVVPCCPGRCPSPPGELFTRWRPRGPFLTRDQAVAVLTLMGGTVPGSRGVLSSDVAVWLSAPQTAGRTALAQLEQAGLVSQHQAGKLTRWTLTPDGQARVAKARRAALR